MARKAIKPESQVNEVFESMDQAITDAVDKIEKSVKTKKVKRLMNAEIIAKIKELKAEIEYERNLRTDRSNIIERENAFQLDGVVRNLHNIAFSFEMFTRPPKAQ